MKIITKNITDIRPYEKNPRKNDKSVEYVAIQSDSSRIDHYEIFRDGRMRVVKRSGDSYFSKPRRHTNGYLRYMIGRKDFYVHRLVATHFFENPNGYNEVNHIDGNKENNCAENLEWCNRSMNNRHAFQTGLRDYKELSVMARMPKPKLRKFNAEQVERIKEMINNGISDTQIAKAFNCSRGPIYQIRVGKTYV